MEENTTCDLRKLLTISEEEALEIAENIVADIPEWGRQYYPENVLLAAIAYAPVYYENHSIWENMRRELVYTGSNTKEE